jgi:hypothetical protein
VQTVVLTAVCLIVYVVGSIWETGYWDGKDPSVDVDCAPYQAAVDAGNTPTDVDKAACDGAIGEPCAFWA